MRVDISSFSNGGQNGPFATVNTQSTPFAGVCGAFGHEKTHTVGDVGLVVL